MAKDPVVNAIMRGVYFKDDPIDLDIGKYTNRLTLLKVPRLTKRRILRVSPDMPYVNDEVSFTGSTVKQIIAISRRRTLFNRVNITIVTTGDAVNFWIKVRYNKNQNSFITLKTFSSTANSSDVLSYDLPAQTYFNLEYQLTNTETAVEINYTFYFAEPIKEVLEALNTNTESIKALDIEINTNIQKPRTFTDILPATNTLQKAFSGVEYLYNTLILAYEQVSGSGDNDIEIKLLISVPFETPANYITVDTFNINNSNSKGVVQFTFSVLSKEFIITIENKSGTRNNTVRGVLFFSKKLRESEINLANLNEKLHASLTGVLTSQHHVKTIASELNLNDLNEKSYNSLTDKPTILNFIWRTPEATAVDFNIKDLGAISSTELDFSSIVPIGTTIAYITLTIHHSSNHYVYTRHTSQISTYQINLYKLPTTNTWHQTILMCPLDANYKCDFISDTNFGNFTTLTAVCIAWTV